LDAWERTIETYLREVASTVLELAIKQEGGAVLGSVPGRPETEDVEIEVDRACQWLLEKWCRETGMGIEVHSEHGISRPSGDEVELQYLLASDPFDGSGLFQRGLAAEWWSVLSIYSINTCQPVAGAAVDILRKEIYLAERDGVTLVSWEPGSGIPLSPLNKTSLDDRTVIAAYMMAPTYLSKWIESGGNLLRTLVDRFPGARLWPNGGSCIYPWLARGLVHAYVMFEEPRSEIDPGLAFAWAAGYPVFSVQADGTLEPYKFIPGKLSERVPFLVAACTEELARAIVKEILPVGQWGS
jgi:fructose-1,6-bisphosphatase/inositol monophosphatase family enzyme